MPPPMDGLQILRGQHGRLLQAQHTLSFHRTNTVVQVSSHQRHGSSSTAPATMMTETALTSGVDDVIYIDVVIDVDGDKIPHATELSQF